MRDNGNVAWVANTSIHSIGSLLFAFVGAFARRNLLLTIPLCVLYVFGIALAIRMSSRSERPAVGYLALSVAVPILVALAVSFLKPIFVPRYLLGALPPFVLLAATGFQRLKTTPMIAMVVAVAVLGLAQDYAFYDAPAKEDWRAAVNFIATHTESHDYLIVYPGFYFVPLQYYIDRGGYERRFPAMVPISTGRGHRDVVERLKQFPALR